KFSVDKPEWLGTGALVFADVGQDAREEADYEPAGKGGRNYGWKVYEGSRLSNFGQLSYSPHSPPFLEYDHSLGFSITGGPIYRGFELGSTYFGAYFFADWVTKKLWSVLPTLDPNGEAVGWSSWTDHTPFVGDLGNIVSIDQGSMGELFITDYFGKIYRISKTNATWISNVSRSDGAIVQGQARSLIASDDKFLRIDHFSPFYTITKKTGLVVEAKTNMTTPSQVSIEVQAKVNQSVTVPSQVLVWNWTSGLYDLVSTYSLNGTLGNHSVIVTSSDHIDPTSMRIRIKLTTVFSGPLAQANYGVMYDKVNISSQ
ncbi:MAG: hypothetical protein JNM34_10325, partial [Chthonomonadaceae bacterium]|nr:hypothetical protein [Chthonomonadaceae bacterium]